jgi:hypothetical protein
VGRQTVIPGEQPQPEQMMSEQPPPIERHAAADRFGKRALGAVHDITVALSEGDDGAGEPVLLRRNGPHRSIGGLQALIDEALVDDAREDDAPDGSGTEPSARTP